MESQGVERKETAAGDSSHSGKKFDPASLKVEKKVKGFRMLLPISPHTGRKGLLCHHHSRALSGLVVTGHSSIAVSVC